MCQTDSVAGGGDRAIIKKKEKKNLILICAFFRRRKIYYHASFRQVGQGGAAYQTPPTPTFTHWTLLPTGLIVTKPSSPFGHVESDHVMTTSCFFKGELFINNRLSSDTCWAGRTRQSPAVPMPFRLPPYLVINRGLL